VPNLSARPQPHTKGIPVTSTRVAEIAKITAAPGKRSELLDALRAMVAQAETEDGTLVYVFHEDAGDDDVIWTYELYADQAGRDAHGASPAMAEIGPKVGHLFGAPPELIKLRPAAGKLPV
jgi:quinol monooxygenase YgiN